MKRYGSKIIGLAFVLPAFFIPDCYAQQMPYYTQYKPNNIMLNPAVVGTKRFADVRLNYRMQWVGLDDAPVTLGTSANSRFFNGTMGAGAAYFVDKTGPTRRTDFSLAYAYHIHFDDVELSLGAAGHSLSYLVNGTRLHMEIPLDNAVDFTETQKKRAYDASAGAYFYNDRFHIGLSALNLLEPTFNYFPSDDTVHRSQIRMVRHLYGSFGYNWSPNLDWIWESSLQLVYAQANPLTIDYNLRLHYKEKMMGGISLRLHDAIAFHVGYAFMNDYYVSYSYDLITSPLRTGQIGSHEIMLIWSSNLGTDKKRRNGNDRFRKQRYGYLF